MCAWQIMYFNRTFTFSHAKTQILNRENLKLIFLFYKANIEYRFKSYNFLKKNFLTDSFNHDLVNENKFSDEIISEQKIIDNKNYT